MDKFRAALKKQEWTDIIYALLLGGVCIAITMSQCKNKTPALSEGLATEYKAEKVFTQTEVEVIDVKCMPNISGEPQYYLVMQNTNKKLNGFTFLVESTPTDAYNMIGRKLLVSTIDSPSSIYPPKAFSLDSWVIDSIIEPR